jgi:rare lipoprotein A
MDVIRDFFIMLFPIQALACLALVSCATSARVVVKTSQNAVLTMPPAAPVAVYQHGKASFYHEPQRTASGERFNKNDLTAAHKKLPLGSRVRVINRNNGKEVVVRINDRGPYAKGRVIDLSLAAAQQLGFVNSGVTSVDIIVEKKG